MFQVIPERWKNKRSLIVAIARHESANFSSNVYKECNNAFGLKTKIKTKCPAPVNEGLNLYYRHFADPAMSVLAFIEWLERRGITPELSDDEILERMGKAGYYTDKNYVEKVKRFLK